MQQSRGIFSSRYIIGIDEVGRGSLAGPVTVAAMVIPRGLAIRRQGWGILKDSKKLSVAQRKKWLAHFDANPKIAYAYAHVSPKIIDRINISQAANRAASLAVRKLVRNHGIPISRCTAYLDGGLFLNRKFCMLDGTPFFPRQAITMIKADEKFPVVAMASIVAKVHRDRLMVRTTKKYPAYGFEAHKGYGTKRHRAAIRKHGVSVIHRRSFIHG